MWHIFETRIVQGYQKLYSYLVQTWISEFRTVVRGLAFLDLPRLCVEIEVSLIAVFWKLLIFNKSTKQKYKSTSSPVIVLCEAYLYVCVWESTAQPDWHWHLFKISQLSMQDFVYCVHLAKGILSSSFCQWSTRGHSVSKLISHLSVLFLLQYEAVAYNW